MNDQTLGLLRDLAGKLGTTIENLWTVMVYGARAEGIASLVASAVLMAVLIGVYKLSDKLIFNNPDYDVEDKVFASIVPMVVGMVVFIFFMVCLYDGVLGVVAPEYTALKSILGVLGGGK